MIPASMSVAPFWRLCGGRRHQLPRGVFISQFAGGCQVVKRAAQIRFGVDQKLPRCYDALPEAKTLQNLRAACVLGADPHARWPEVSAILCEDHNTSRAGFDHRLSRNGQRLRARGTAKMHRREHTRSQTLNRIVDNDSRFQGSRSLDQLWIHIIDLAGEALAR